jgi:N4-gp56 family major capsid protein
MATSTYPTMTGAVGISDVATFVPDIWSDEIRASYEKNLVVANLVKKISMKGKKGDVIHLPAPIRGSAFAKAENTAVTIQNNTESEVQVVINRHFEYSRMIEDIVAVQALDSLRQFYTSDAGYALSTQVDNDLWLLGQTLGNGTNSWVHNASFYIDASTGLTAYALDQVIDNDVFTDAGFRALIQKMDDADVPMDRRVFVIPPSLRNAIMGENRYMSTDFMSGGGRVEKGKIGELYGIDIFVSSNSPVVETNAANEAVGNNKDLRAALLFHRDTFIMAEQMGVRSQTQYKQEYLANLYTADTLYGVKTFRPDSGFVLVVNN